MCGKWLCGVFLLVADFLIAHFCELVKLQGLKDWGGFQSRTERLGDFPVGSISSGGGGEPIFTQVPQKIAALNRGGGRLGDFTYFTTRIE